METVPETYILKLPRTVRNVRLVIIRGLLGVRFTLEILSVLPLRQHEKIAKLLHTRIVTRYTQLLHYT